MSQVSCSFAVFGREGFTNLLSKEYALLASRILHKPSRKREDASINIPVYHLIDLEEGPERIGGFAGVHNWKDHERE